VSLRMISSAEKLCGRRQDNTRHTGLVLPGSGGPVACGVICLLLLLLLLLYYQYPKKPLESAQAKQKTISISNKIITYRVSFSLIYIYICIIYMKK
jgi:hypothetical protein